MEEKMERERVKSARFYDKVKKRRRKCDCGKGKRVMAVSFALAQVIVCFSRSLLWDGQNSRRRAAVGRGNGCGEINKRGKMHNQRRRTCLVRVFAVLYRKYMLDRSYGPRRRHTDLDGPSWCP